MAFDETPPIMGPWWIGNTFAGNLGLQVPQEVPLTVSANGKPPEIGSKTTRQVMFNPAAYDGDINAAFNGPVSGVSDSDNSTQAGMLRRVSAKIASTYQNYRKMRADGIVAIGREIADGLVCTNQWTYEGADEEEDGGDYSPDEIKEMVAAVKCMWEGRGTSGKSHEGFSLREYFLSESCRAKDHGNHTLEVAWDEDDEGEITIGEFLPLLPEHTRPLVYTGTRRFAGVRNWGLNGGPVDLDPQYCVRFIYDSEGGDFGGRSRFENCKDWILTKWEIREKLRTDMNITIGNTPIVRFPVVKNDPVKTAANQAKAGIINIALRQGFGVTVPGWDVNDALAILKASPGVDLSKLDPWAIKNLEKGDNSFAGFKVATDLVDEQILFGLLVLPRTVREADHGSKADSEQHTENQVAMDWRWLTYVAGLANNITDAFLIQRFGPGARGKVQVKAAPIADEAKAILRQIYSTLLSDKDLAVKILNIKQDLQKLQIKPKADFDQDVLARQMAANGAGDALSSRAKLQNAGYKDDEIDKIQQDKAGEDAVPTDADGLGRPRVMSEDDDRGGAGHWITLGGHKGEGDEEGGGGVHVFIHDGRITKGPKDLQGRHLNDLTHEQRESMHDARKTREVTELSPEERKAHGQVQRKYSESGIHRELLNWHKEQFGGGVEEHLGGAAHGNVGISKETAKEHVRGGGSVAIYKQVKGGMGEDFRSELIASHGSERGERLYQDWVKTRLSGDAGKVDEAITAAKSNSIEHPRMAYLAHHVEHLPATTAQEEVHSKNFVPGDSFTSHGEEFTVHSDHGITVLRGAGMEFPYADTMGRLPIDKDSYQAGDPFGMGGSSRPGIQKSLLGARYESSGIGSKTKSMFGDVSRDHEPEPTGLEKKFRKTKSQDLPF